MRAGQGNRLIYSARVTSTRRPDLTHGRADLQRARSARRADRGAASRRRRRGRLELELVVVDDNSPDGTGALADELARRRGGCRWCIGRANWGSARRSWPASMRRLADVVGVMDADFSHPPALVPKLLAVFHATEADVRGREPVHPGRQHAELAVQAAVLSRVGVSAGASAVADSRCRRRASSSSGARSPTAWRFRRAASRSASSCIVRGRPRRLVEMPYQFDDRELGESKMSFREASGYLVQLKDLYLHRLSQRDRRRPTTYRQLAHHEVERIAQYGA